jgi:hypothetical protein
VGVAPAGATAAIEGRDPSPAVTMLNQPRSVPASTAVPTAAAKQHDEKNDDEKRGDIHLRIPLKCCAADNVLPVVRFQESTSQDSVGAGRSPSIVPAKRPFDSSI